MNEFRKIIIEDERNYILRDLSDLEEVLIELQSSGVINDSDKDQIQRSQNKGAKLLDIFLKKSDDLWFEEFCKALNNSYSWISEKLLKIFHTEAARKKEFYLHVRGNVPLPPSPNVHRSAYIEKLRSSICMLKRHNYLVIHGMSGCGKTSLACNALNDIRLLESCLKGCVYWLPVGELKYDENAGDLHCQELQKKLCDIVGLTTHPQTDLLSQLKQNFAINQNYSALLVLDNVMSSNVIKALDIGCKTLVTTQDVGVMLDVKTRSKFFPIESGFTESESVQLLTDFVADGEAQLPPRIKQLAINIHRVWKGQPMVIGLIGGQLAEKSTEALQSEACWKEYEKNPTTESNGDNAYRRRSLIEQQMTSVIDKTISKLGSNLKTLYQNLVVFVEDANITREVLETLWEKHDVESIMNTLCRRSLAVRKHHPYLKVWVYGIHAMLVAHMKENLTKEEQRHMHQELLLKYYEKCKGDFSKLPHKDNYIFTYICHHIEHAEAWDTYRDQFFSLNYLESKLRATGPGDLLLDLHKYHKGLVGINDNYKKQIEDIIKFVERSGWDVYKHKMNIIQCALLEPEASVIYSWASAMCLKASREKTVYFLPLNNPREKPKEIEMLVPNVKALCLIPSAHSDGRVLIAPHDKEGYIAEMDMKFRWTRRTFEVGNVILISLSKCQDKFLSGSEDGVVNVWSLTSENTINANTPPPSMRQRNNELFHFSESRTIPTMFKKHNACVTSASFSHDGKFIVSASDAGDVTVWSVDSETIEPLTFYLHPSPSAVSCAFLPDSNMIVFGCSDHKIFFCDIPSRTQKVNEETDRNFGRIISILPLSDDIRKLVVVQLKAASIWSWDSQVLVHQADGSRRTELRGLVKRMFHEESSNITCAAYAEHRLVLGTSQRGCCVFKTDESFEWRPKSWIGSGMIKAVSVSRDRLVYSSGSFVRMCWPELGSSFSCPNQGYTVCLGWSNRNVSLWASTSRNKKILVYSDGKLTNDRLVSRDISSICFSLDGNHVVAGCEDGEVLLFDLVAKSLKVLTSFLSRVTYLQFRMLGNDSVCIAAADPSNSSDSESQVKDRCFMQVIHERNHVSLKCPGLSSQLVDAFTYSTLLIAVLSDYSLVVWNLYFKRGCSFKPIAQQVLQEGRKSARVTGASISSDCKTLVLSDEEKCFHIFSIYWPEVFKNDDIHSHNFVAKTKSLKLNIPPPVHQPFSSPSAYHSIHNGSVDVVDGAVNSTVSSFPYTSMSTFELPDPAWCCDTSKNGKVIALGCGVNKVHIWDTIKKTEIAKFDILPNSYSKVSHIKFSRGAVMLTNKCYESLLLVVSDCFSLWDLSPLLSEGQSPSMLGCVKSGGLPFLDVSVSASFMKFAGVDSSGTYFLWDIKD